MRAYGAWEKLKIRRLAFAARQLRLAGRDPFELATGEFSGQGGGCADVQSVPSADLPTQGFGRQADGAQAFGEVEPAFAGKPLRWAGRERYLR